MYGVRNGLWQRCFLSLYRGFNQYKTETCEYFESWRVWHAARMVIDDRMGIRLQAHT